MVAVLRTMTFSEPTNSVGYLVAIECVYLTSALPPLNPTVLIQARPVRKADVSVAAVPPIAQIELMSTNAAMSDPEGFRGRKKATNSASEENAQRLKMMPT